MINKTKKFHLAYFVSHPIQYQSPLLKEISNHSDIDLTVFFQSNFSLKEHWDVGFKTKFKWDINLLDGYKYRFLKILSTNNKLGFFSPIVSGVFSALKSKKWDAVWFHGYNHYSILWALFLCKILNIPFFMRMESNLNFAPKGKWLKDKFIKYLIKNASGLLYIGKSNKDYYLSYGADKEKIFSMPYTVNNSFFQNLSNKEKRNIHLEKKKLGLKEEYPIILYAGKLLKRKNPLKLLESYTYLSNDGIPPKAYLLFIGDGEEKEVLQKNLVVWGVPSMTDFIINLHQHFLHFLHRAHLTAAARVRYNRTLLNGTTRSPSNPGNLTAGANPGAAVKLLTFVPRQTSGSAGAVPTLPKATR